MHVTIFALTSWHECRKFIIKIMDSRGPNLIQITIKATNLISNYCIWLVAIIYNREWKNVSLKVRSCSSKHCTDSMLLVQGQGFQKHGVTGIPSACMVIFLSGYFETWAHHTLTAFPFPLIEAERSYTGYALDTNCACLVMRRSLLRLRTK